MKRIKISLIFVLISIISTFGQDYQTISSNRIAFFDNEYSNIKCIRIDSVKHQVDSVLFPFAAIQQLDYDCFSPLIASWIGKSVTIKDNGLNEFINKMGDTISIKANANLGDKWIAFALQDSLTIEATVLSHDTLSFLGINDSVKTIGFQSYDKDMNQRDLGLNNMQLQISKNYGFVKLFNFYLFPYFQVDYPTEIFEEYELIGLSNPKVGVNNLTWFEVNDFQVGDELHVLDESSCWYGNGYGSATTNKAIYKYLERTDYSDSIVYLYSRKQSISTTWTDSSDFKYYDDTLKTIIKLDSLFDMMPGEPIITDYETYNYYMTNESPLSKTNPRGYESFGFGGDSCWWMILADGCLTADKYIKGLGGPYYSCTQAFCLGGAERKLVYYKKVGDTWGSPLLITRISDISIAKNIMIYPNPAKSNINITFSNNNYQDSYLYIYDVQGRLQNVKHLVSNNSLINISDLSSGIYILYITDNERVLKMERLIIE
jgi:hypothetical protein